MDKSDNRFLWLVAAIGVFTYLWFLGEFLFIHDAGGFPIGVRDFDVAISGIVFFMTVAVGGLLCSIWRITHD
jgi:hypothetical protein